ncbi:cyanophycinase [Nocardioides sp.]|uniref:cyanophycinase n=1 Tax=Nocardioides sp. TaxID=35761 RepID=UPI002737227B|nr:cyanophycinase [Nocardioides sp.]MDP3892187.1 cyanophycinase [Nocardioides sp.]
MPDLDPTPDQPPSAPARRGPLMIIGGAEDKLGRRRILQRFVAASGGDEARIAVIATASSLGPEVVEVYDALFRRLGAADVVSVRPESRSEAHDPALVGALREATGIFMTGGNQLKLSGVICGTPFGEAIVEAHHRGVAIGGTSAGASIQSSHMVAFGVGGSTPKQRMTQVAAGLGLLESTVIDQHFEQRNRYGRLLMIVSQSPQLIGLGVDEDTAAVVTHEDGQEILRVAGKGAVTLFDPSHVVTDAHEAPRSAPLLTSGVVLHVLPEGSEFNLSTRTLVPRHLERDPGEVAELATAGRDLRQLARDIAAADASPGTFRRRMAGNRLRALKLSRSTPTDTEEEPTP